MNMPFLRMSRIVERTTRICGNHVKTTMMIRYASHMSKQKVTREDVHSESRAKQASFQQCFDSFEDMIRTEKKDASNFLVIEDKCSSMEYHSTETLAQVLDSQVQDVYRFAVGPRSFSLVRLADIDQFTKNSSPFQFDVQFPIHSKILTLKTFPKGVKKVKADSRLHNLSLERLASNKRIHILKSSGPDHENVIQRLTQSCSMTELGSKLRFIFLNHLEEIVCSGLFRHFELMPFGSSVNGFGDDASDFDVVMTAKIDKNDVPSNDLQHLGYQCKPAVTERFQSQRLVDFVGDQLQFFTPGIMSVTRIPRARVPIVKLYSDIFSLDCDVSFCSDYPVRMAKALFHFSKLDARVKQLASFIKLWAKSQDLTNSNPGPWFTNFELLLMVINFFQTRGKDVFNLPPMNQLDRGLTFESKQDANASFINNLQEFLEFIADFEYPHYGMSILQGKIVVKPHHDYVYIENPLEPDLNVSKNVSKTEVLRLVKCARNSLEIITSKKFFSLYDLCIPFTKNTSSAFVTFHNKNRGSRGIRLDDYLIDDSDGLK